MPLSAADMVIEGEEEKHLFAPRDSKLMVFDQKSGKEGLGYVKGQGMHGLGKGNPVEKAATNVSGTYSPKNVLECGLISIHLSHQLDSAWVSMTRTKMIWTFTIPNRAAQNMAEGPPMTSTNTTTMSSCWVLASLALTRLEGVSKDPRKKVEFPKGRP